MSTSFSAYINYPDAHLLLSILIFLLNSKILPKSCLKNRNNIYNSSDSPTAHSQYFLSEYMFGELWKRRKQFLKELGIENILLHRTPQLMQENCKISEVYTFIPFSLIL